MSILTSGRSGLVVATLALSACGTFEAPKDIEGDIPITVHNEVGSLDKFTMYAHVTGRPPPKHKNWLTDDLSFEKGTSKVFRLKQGKYMVHVGGGGRDGIRGDGVFDLMRPAELYLVSDPKQVRATPPGHQILTLSVRKLPSTGRKFPPAQGGGGGGGGGEDACTDECQSTYETCITNKPGDPNNVCWNAMNACRSSCS